MTIVLATQSFSHIHGTVQPLLLTCGKKPA